MNLNAANIFLELEEAIELYLDTRQDALRLRVIILRRQLLDELVCRCAEHEPYIQATGQLDVPKWLAGEKG